MLGAMKPAVVAGRMRGFTLVELMIVVAIGALLVLLVAPSFHDMILMQRLRGTNAQLVTDMQFARSEAVARGAPLRVVMRQDASQTCYTLYTALSNSGTSRCNCLLGAGNACTTPSVEVKTVSLPRSAKVSLTWPAEQDNGFAYEPVRGGLLAIPNDLLSTPLARAEMEIHIDADRRLRTSLLQSGRPSVCSPNVGVMGGTACPSTP